MVERLLALGLGLCLFALGGDRRNGLGRPLALGVEANLNLWTRAELLFSDPRDCVDGLGRFRLAPVERAVFERQDDPLGANSFGDPVLEHCGQCGLLLLEGADGSWRGTGRAVEDADDRFSQYALVGEGAYEGLYALIRGTPGMDTHGPWDHSYEGYIFEGELPLFPDSVEPITTGGMQTFPFPAEPPVE